jgi:molecular chaperone DnaK (HSP70)
MEEKMSVIRYIGIDFGTSTSVIRIKDYDENGQINLEPPKAVLEPKNNETIIKTLVFVPEDKESPVVCGNDAMYQNRKGTLYTNFKMLLESENKENVTFATYLIREFLKYIKELYVQQKDKFGSCDEEKTFISFPVKWPDTSMKIMKKLAQEAGFKNVEGVTEPMAAILSVLMEKLSEFQIKKLILPNIPSNVLLVDMGAGTTDLVLFRIKLLNNDISVEIITTWPPANVDISFGGREVEAIICQSVLNQLIPNDEEKRKKRYERMIDGFKAWKETTLSSTLSRKERLINPPTCVADYMEAQDMDESEFEAIDRNQFEKIMEPYIEQFPSLINGCLEHAKKADNGINSNEDIDFVVVTGGHSQWYFVKEMLLGNMTSKSGSTINLPKLIRENDRFVHSKYPQETVANGMAYKGFSLDIKAVAANSVWLRFKIGETWIEKNLAIEKDAILPFKDRITFNRYITAEFSTDSSAPNGLDNDYAIPCIGFMFIGENFENSKAHRLDLTVKNFSVSVWFTDFVKTLFSKQKTFTKEYYSAVVIDISMDEQQNITLEGAVAFDNGKKLAFNY